MDETQIQSRLSNKLQLLHLLTPSPWEAKTNHSITIMESLEGALLDALTLYLQGPRLGDITAVTMERRRCLTFVLMRNRPLEPYDRQATEEFFQLINQESTQLDLLRFVANTSTANLNKARRKVGTSPVIEILRQRLQDYEPSSIQSEFRITEAAVTLVSTKFETNDAKKVLSMSLDRLQQQLVQDLQPPVPQDDIGELHRLINTAKLLNVSIFFSSMLSKLSPDPAMSKFQRQLEKLVQYDKAGIAIIIRRNRFAPCNESRFGHRWVELSEEDYQSPAVTVSESPSEAISQANPSMSSMATSLVSSYPGVAKNWRSIIYPSNHVEILLLCRMHIEDGTLGEHSYYEQTRMISSTKRTCPCCHIALQAYNSRNSTRWKSTNVNGRKFMDWSVTGVSWLDKEVEKWVDAELSRTFRSLGYTNPAPRRQRKRKRSIER